MTAMLKDRRARIDAGEKPVGWKVASPTKASQQQIGVTAPMVGVMMQRHVLPPGGTVRLGGWQKPVAEPELAVRMALSVAGGATESDALAAVKEIFPAIELVDVDRDRTPDTLEDILANNLFHRHVVLCGNTRAGGSTAGLTSRVLAGDKELARTDDVEGLTGPIAGHILHVANTLAAFGEKLGAGDVIICGSLVPPIALTRDMPGLTHTVDPIGTVSIAFDHG